MLGGGESWWKDKATPSSGWSRTRSSKKKLEHWGEARKKPNGKKIPGYSFLAEKWIPGLRKKLGAVGKRRAKWGWFKPIFVRQTCARLRVCGLLGKKGCGPPEETLSEREKRDGVRGERRKTGVGWKVEKD